MAWMDPENSALLRRVIRGGGRLVLTFQPRRGEALPPLTNAPAAASTNAVEVDESKPADRAAEPEKTAKASGKESDEKEKPQVSLEEWLGADLHDIALPEQGSVEAYWDDTVERPETFPPRLACRTSLCLTNLVGNWQVLYRRAHLPVIAERRIGKGTLVVSTLSYFVSNEALHKDRHASLLAWLVGDKSRIIFDERHHGIEHELGLVALARLYHFEWAGGVLLVVALLLLWQSSVPLVPHERSVRRGLQQEIIVGRDSLSGLVSLLRLSIQPRRILAVCAAQWRKSQRRLHGAPQDVRKVTDLVGEAGTGTVRAAEAVARYNEIVEAIRAARNPGGVRKTEERKA